MRAMAKAPVLTPRAEDFPRWWLAEHSVSVRCLVAEDGAVPEADETPGNVAVVARAY